MTANCKRVLLKSEPMATGHLSDIRKRFRYLGDSR